MSLGYVPKNGLYLESKITPFCPYLRSWRQVSNNRRSVTEQFNHRFPTYSGYLPTHVTGYSIQFTKTYFVRHFSLGHNLQNGSF